MLPFTLANSADPCADEQLGPARTDNWWKRKPALNYSSRVGSATQISTYEMAGCCHFHALTAASSDNLLWIRSQSLCKTTTMMMKLLNAGLSPGAFFTRRRCWIMFARCFVLPIARRFFHHTKRIQPCSQCMFAPLAMLEIVRGKITELNFSMIASGI